MKRRPRGDSTARGVLPRRTFLAAFHFMEPPSSIAATHDPSATARMVHEDLEHTFVSHSESDSVLVHLAKSGGERVWRAMKRHPFVSVLAVAVSGTALAAAVGVAELTFGAALGYAAYKVLREGEPPLEAIEEVEREVLGTSSIVPARSKGDERAS